MNIRLLNKIKDHILEEPKHFDMESWLEPDREATRPTCGTTCCIGGWAAVENGWKALAKKEDGHWRTYFCDPDGNQDYSSNLLIKAAQKYLNITPIEADALFYTDYWPWEFAEIAKDDDATPEDKAANAVARIDYFIKTGE